MSYWPSIKQVKAVRRRSAGSSGLEVVRIVTMKLQIWQLRSEVRFLVVPELATNIVLGTTFIGKYTERVSPTTSLTTPCDSSSVAFDAETRCDHITNISVEKIMNDNRNSTDEHSCGVFQVITLLTKSETAVQVKLPAKASGWRAHTKIWSGSRST